MLGQFFSDEQFKPGKKWFFVGLFVALFSALAGLAFGLALVTEKGHRKEGVIVMAFAIICFFVKNLWLGPWLMQSDILPYRFIRIR